jgi:hypothetical protein
MTTIIDERRKRDRVKTNLDALWEGVMITHKGTVVDISETGCFMLTPDEVKPKELVRVEIVLPNGQTLHLWGEVVYQIPDMGFGVRFTRTDESEHEKLEAFVCKLKTEIASGNPVLRFYGHNSAKF